MPNLKYGPMDNPGRVEEEAFAASEIFHEFGAAFTFRASGNLEAAAAADAALCGWAMLGFSVNDPHVTGSHGSRIFTTSATAGEKHSHMKATPATTYIVPADANYAKATHANKDCDLVVTSNKQMADIGTSSTNVLRITGGREGAAEVFVQIIDSKILVAAS